MFVDAQLLFSDGQAITNAAGSGNTIDLGIAARNPGHGEDLYVFVTVDVAFTDTGSNSTLTVALEGDSTESFSPDGSRDLMIIPALAPIGAKYYAKLSPSLGSTDGANYQYIRLKYTPNNGDLSTGTITAGIVRNIDNFQAYADGFTIS